MTDTQSSMKRLTDDLVFGEGPRWREDRLWFSDMHGEAVWTVDLAGHREKILDLPGRRPSGLGFLPDGDLLIVSMLDRQILRLSGSVLSLHADLSDKVAVGINDMVVDTQGRAYVGSFPPPATPAGVIVLVDPDGTSRIASDEVTLPNGAVITPDGASLIVAESLGRCLTSFDIATDGSLSNRKMFADLPGFGPDGICLDEEGAIWAAMPLARGFLRIRPGGQVTEMISLEGRMAIVCALGGPDRRSLFLLTALEHAPSLLEGTREARIDVGRVTVPGAGIP